MICYFMAVPFLTGALLCAIYGICQGSIKHGLALLAIVSVLIALIMVGQLWVAAQMSADAQRRIQQMFQQH
jgi:hypothetical protein